MSHLFSYRNHHVMAAMVVKKLQDHKGVLGLRVSFGTVEQMKQVIKALDELPVRWVGEGRNVGCKARKTS